MSSLNTNDAFLMFMPPQTRSFQHAEATLTEDDSLGGMTDWTAGRKGKRRKDPGPGSCLIANK